MKIHATKSNAGGESTGGKFLRVFATLDEIRERLVVIETRDETQRAEVAEIKKQLGEVQKMLYQIIGKESVRSSIYGVVGAIVASVVTWIISLFGN